MNGVSKFIATATQWFVDAFNPHPYSLSDCKTIEDLKVYAASISKSDPGFASDLFAVCYRAEME